MAAIMVALYPNASFAQPVEDKESADSFTREGSLGKVEGTSKVKFNGDSLKGYIADAKYILTSPSRWEKSDWLRFSLVAGTTIGLYALDRKSPSKGYYLNKNKISSDTTEGPQCKISTLPSFPSLEKNWFISFSYV